MTDKEKIEKLIEEELQDANSKYGDTFHSPHEAWAVILEEIEEADEELSAARGCNASFWYDIRENAEHEGQVVLVTEMRKHAIQLIQEAIQVAAMAQKALNSL